MLSDTLVEAFRVRLAALGLDLADLRIGGTSGRPLVQVRIDWPAEDPPRQVSVDDCALASRTLETWLDAERTLGERYVLEVSSPGMCPPLRCHRPSLRFVSPQVHARLPA